MYPPSVRCCALRLEASLSQAELAERAGLSARAIADLEQGRRRSPYPQTIRQLAHGLSLTAHDHLTF
jgi:transcriptional regulator with XRE-family HTH domain